jgi:hypothetical protein
VAANASIRRRPVVDTAVAGGSPPAPDSRSAFSATCRYNQLGAKQPVRELVEIARHRRLPYLPGRAAQPAAGQFRRFCGLHGSGAQNLAGISLDHVIHGGRLPGFQRQMMGASAPP